MNAMARRARLFYLIAVTIVAIGSFGLGPLRDFFDFSLPTVWILWPAITLIALSATIQWQMAKVASQKFKSQQKKNSAL